MFQSIQQLFFAQTVPNHVQHQSQLDGRVSLIFLFSFSFSNDTDSSAIASANQAFEKQKSVFNLNDYSISGRGDQEINWQYLPGTEQELNKIMTLLGDENITTTYYSGYQATEESFKSIGVNNPSPSILHIATHGFFFPDIKKDKENLDLGGSGFRFSENPLIRSGLIMAGANQAWRESQFLMALKTAFSLAK